MWEPPFAGCGVVGSLRWNKLCEFHCRQIYNSIEVFPYLVFDSNSLGKDLVTPSHNPENSVLGGYHLSAFPVLSRVLPTVLQGRCQQPPVTGERLREVNLGEGELGFLQRWSLPKAPITSVGVSAPGEARQAGRAAQVRARTAPDLSAPPQPRRVPHTGRPRAGSRPPGGLHRLSQTGLAVLHGFPGHLKTALRASLSLDIGQTFHMSYLNRDSDETFHPWGTGA